ncbi:MAG: sugar ABC transporter permease [Bacillota bacterium]|nr:sugar ABC transporter permease [Bacillota bacterium]
MAVNKMTKHRLNQYIFIYSVLAPILFLFGVIRIFPMINTVILSFQSWNLIRPDKIFVGLLNYEQIFSDPMFLESTKNTVGFVILVVGIGIPLALFFANLVQESKKLRGFYESVFFFPTIATMVSVSLVWKWMYDASYGFFNYLLSLVGIAKIGWLTTPDMALISISIMTIWKTLGYNMMIFLVGLRAIDISYYEAAEIDGANRWQKFRFVTLPLLKPITLFIFVMSILNTMMSFTQFYAMTSDNQGSPGAMVSVLVYDIYQRAFVFHNMGPASAEAILLFIGVLFVTIIQFRIAKD